MNSPRLSLTQIQSRRRSNGATPEKDWSVDGTHRTRIDVEQAGIETFQHTGLVLSERGHRHSNNTVNVDQENSPELPLACMLFSIVGVGYLFPFSALTQAPDYWNLLFPDFNIEFPLTTIYMYTNLITLTLLVFLGGTPNFTQRIVGGFVGQLLVLLFVPTTYFWHLDETTNAMVILGATAVAAIVTAFIDSSVIALASQYPLRVQEYFQFGVGLSTLIGSIYRDMTKIAFPPEMIVESSLLYFYSGAATIAFCILSYYRLMQLNLSNVCLAQAYDDQESNHHQHPPPKDEPQQSQQQSETSTLLPKTKKENAKDDASKQSNKWQVLRKIFFNESMVLLLFMSTLALWPPLVTEIQSFNFPSLQSSGWWSLILLTVFSASDCTGRLLVRFRMGITVHNIWIPILARFCLFPLIFLSAKGVWVTHDALSILFVGLLGFTNGYVGTLSIVLVNECCSNEEEQAIAGTFTGFFLNTGLVFGASIGLICDQFV